MKKFLLLLFALSVVGGVKAVVTLNATFQTPAANGAWNAETNTYTWTGSTNNLMTIFTFPNGELANYTKIHLEVAQETHHNFRFCLMNGGDVLGQVTCWSSGTKDITFATHDNTKNVDLSQVTHIAFGGASAPDPEKQEESYSCVLTNVYLEGPDPLYRTVYTLGSPITFAQALASSDPFVLVQNGKVLCGPLSPSDNSLTFKDVSEIVNYSWTINFEEDTDHDGSYFMQLQNANGASKGYINASVWSHTFLSGVDKTGTKGEQQDGALWTIAETSVGSGKYNIKNLGVLEGSYDNKPNGDEGDRAAAGQGYLGITTSGYWANHVTIYNTEGEWEFYTLNTQQQPINDPVYFGWDGLIFSNSENVTVNEENRFVRDANDWAPYWSETAKWEFDTPFDASEYRYLVFYAKRNVTRYGNGENNTGGSVFIRDNSGVSFRGDDYTRYGDPAVDYPDHTGSMWMNINGKQRATVVDLQWLANTNKFGDGSGCKVLDTHNITAFGFSGDFTIGGAYFTNTLPDFDNGDYKREYNEAGITYDNFGTICLPYSAVCCGADIYEISGKNSDGITLTEHEGVMEAGKPYFFKTLEAKQQYWGNLHDENGVYFFKAGYDMVESPVENNGLIGTFTNIQAPASENCWILSNNQLYDTAGSTVTVGANKAYINTESIMNQSTGGAKERVIYFGDATGINAVEVKEAVKTLNDGVFYDLSGRKVSRPTRGLYIVNGKKVYIK